MKFDKVVSYTVIGIVTNAVLMIASFLFIRVSPPEIAGDYFFFVAASSLLVNVSLWGNATYYNKKVVDGVLENNKALLANFRVFFLLFLLLSSVFFSFEIFSGKSIIWLAVFFEAGLLKVYRERIYCSYSRVYLSSIEYVKIQGLYVLLRLVCVLIYYFELIDVFTLIFLWVGGSSISLLQSKDFLESIFNLKYKSSLKNYIAYGSPFFLATLFTMGYDYAPVISLKYVSGDLFEMGIFSAVYKITSITILSLALLSQSLLPYFRHAYNQYGKAHTIKLSIKILIVIYILYAPVFYTLYFKANNVISWFIGNGYLHGEDSLKVQLIGLWGSIANFCVFTVLQAIDRQKLVAILVAPSAVGNIILSVVLASKGSLGVSLALSISLISCGVISLSTILYELRFNNENKI